jgi:outer membrane protein assembly factor BamB
MIPVFSIDRPQLIVSPRRLVRLWDQTRKKFSDGEYQVAVELAYRLLQTGSDGFYRPDGDTPRLASLRRSARDLIRRLPREQWIWYELQYGVTAKTQLRNALLHSDAVALERVARDFPLTEAGLEATYRLGSLRCDRGQFLAAALEWDRVLSAGRPTGQWEPQLSIRTALAWTMSGQRGKALAVLGSLSATHGGQKFEIAGRSLVVPPVLADHGAWLIENFKFHDLDRVAQRVDWMMSGNNPSRTGMGFSNAERPQQRWTHSLLQDPLKDPALEESTPTDELLQEVLKQLGQRYRRQARPLIASAQPVVVNGTIYVRSVGTHRAVLLDSGSRLWETMASEPVEDVLTRAATGAGRMQSLMRLLDRQYQNDEVYGTMSADERFLYTVERVGDGSSAVNLLVAYHAAGTRRSGQRAWSVGGSDDDVFLKSPLSGTLFLGPPLPLNGLLYVMARRNGEYLLVVLDPVRSGREIWSQPLANATLPLQRAAVRGSVLSFADGILVCCCDSQTVAAIELTTRSLRWGYQAQTTKHKPGRPLLPPVVPRPGRPLPARVGWVDRHALIESGHVVLTAADADELHCLKLTDGSLEWKVPRGDGLYVAGVHRERAIVVGLTSVRALKLADGHTEWTRPLPVGKPAGRAVIARQQLHVPLDSGQIVSLDLADGQQVGSIRSPGDTPWLNLIHARGLVVAQGLDQISVFPVSRLAADVDQRPASK